MLIGTVTGPIRTRNSLDGTAARPLLQIRTEGGTVVAADLAGAAPGDRVLLATGDAARRYAMLTPIDAVAIAVLEEQE